MRQGVHCKQGEVGKEKCCHGERPGVFRKQQGVQKNCEPLRERSRAKWLKDLNTRLRNWDLISAADKDSTSLLAAERSHAYRVVQEYS